MADKARRSTDKLMNSLTRPTKAEVCSRSRAIKEQIQSEIIKLAHDGDMEAIRNLANEGQVITNILTKC